MKPNHHEANNHEVLVQEPVQNTPHQLCLHLIQSVLQDDQIIEVVTLLHTPENQNLFLCSACPDHFLLKRKSSPITGLECPREFLKVKVHRFHDNGT